jgi:hypothetical protein
VPAVLRIHKTSNKMVQAHFPEPTRIFPFLLLHSVKEPLHLSELKKKLGISRANSSLLISWFHVSLKWESH